ncbi:MAG: Holliday junction branch migration protein RuvA [Eggerthellaceae bacterium]|nr:Holliday junction branch migration protein RuvA [Eggerthellaceae bacterium]
MIAFLKGTLTSKTATQALIDVNGVGFAVYMAGSSIAKLPPLETEVTIQTYLQVSDSGWALYGFLSLDEKTLFEKLISVSGVGPKVALAALSTYSPELLVNAIATEDIGLVQKIPGVGKKTASRIVLELKGSVSTGAGNLFAFLEDEKKAGEQRIQGAMDALLSMGFTQTEAELALKGAPEGGTEEVLLQYALKRLGAGL